MQQVVRLTWPFPAPPLLLELELELLACVSGGGGVAGGLVGEGGGELRGGELSSWLLAVGGAEAALKLAAEGPEVPSGVLNGVVEVEVLLLPSAVPGAGGEAVPAGGRGGVRMYERPASGHQILCCSCCSVRAGTVQRCLQTAERQMRARHHRTCTARQHACNPDAAQAAGSEGQAALSPVAGSGLLGGGGLLGSEGGVTVAVVTGVAAVEAVTGVAAVEAVTGVAAVEAVTGVAAAVVVAGTSAEVVAAVVGALCCTAALVLAVPVVSEKVAATSAGQAACKI